MEPRPQDQSQQHKTPQVYHKPKIDTISWSLLEGFSRVTELARQAASGKPQRIDLNTIMESLDLQPTLNESSEIGAFEIIPDISEVIPNNRMPEITPEEWISFFDEEGRITDVEHTKKRIFYGGFDPSVRREGWKFITGMYKFESNYIEREKETEEMKKKYEKLKNVYLQLKNIEPEIKFKEFHNNQHDIEKDVVRTDRHIDFYKRDDNDNLIAIDMILNVYCLYNFDLGYVQGMNEILSPIYYIMDNEEDAFWCFKCVMDKMEDNFETDHRGIRNQNQKLLKIIELLDPPLYNHLKVTESINMLFCFRWLLILFKREFSFGTIQRLWEVLWSNYNGYNDNNDYHLFFAYSILRKHRSQILNNNMQFDDLLRFVNSLSGSLQLDDYLNAAEYYQSQYLASISQPSSVQSVSPASSNVNI